MTRSKQEQITRVVLDSIADGVFAVDHNWRITLFNPAAERITGIGREEAIGRYCWDVFRANICEAGCALRRTVETGQPRVPPSRAHARPRRMHQLRRGVAQRSKMGRSCLAPGTTNDGWHSGWDNKILLGTRHRELPNVLYMDGRVSSDKIGHPEPSWNMYYDKLTGATGSNRWRASTFLDDMKLANLGTGHHLLPALKVHGWECFFQGK